MPETFQHEHVAKVPRGYKVRTVARGDHEIRVAFPPGRRVRGSGQLVEILHPAGENPLCKIVNLVNPSTLERKRSTRERSRRIRAARGNPVGWYQVIAVRKGGTLGQTIDMEFPTLEKAKEFAKTIDRDVFKKPVITVSNRNPAASGRLTRKQKDFYLAQYDYWLNVEGATEEKSARYALEDLFKKFPRLRKKNPDDGELAAAEGLYEEFHGREPREILELQESAETRREYTALGDLVELTMIAPNGDRVQIKFKSDGVRVASSPNGEQLYLLGGNQDISGSLGMFGADERKDLIDLGEAKQIVYDAAKWQTDFTAQEWKHDFGEESGVRPRGFFDQLKKRIFFAGGNYKVERPGIVD